MFNSGDILTAAKADQMFTLIDSGSVTSGSSTTSAYGIFSINSYSSQFSNFVTILTCRPLTSGAHLGLKLSSDGATVAGGSGDYRTAAQQVIASTSSAMFHDGSQAGPRDSSIIISQSLDNNTSETASFVINLYNANLAGLATGRQMVTWTGIAGHGSNDLYAVMGAGLTSGTNNPIKGHRFDLTAGNFESASWRTYGR